MNPVGIAVLGSGWFAGEHARAIAATPGARLVVNYSPSPARRAVFARTWGSEAVSSEQQVWEHPDVEAVVVATPHSTHAPLIVAALQHGRDVLVEKPMTLTVADAERVAAAEADSSARVLVAHNRRRHPGIRRARQMIADGGLGTVLQATAFIAAPGGHKTDLPPWRSDPAECPAGGMTALGVHMVDTLSYLLGPITSVSAVTSPGVARTRLDEATAALFEHSSGALSTLGTSYFARPEASVTVYGDVATLKVFDDGEHLERIDSHGVDEWHTAPVNTVALQTAELVDLVRERREPETGTEVGRAVAEVLEAISFSAEEGCRVAVNTRPRAALRAGATHR